MDLEEVPQEYYSHLAKQGFQIEKRIGGGLSGGVYRAIQGSLGRSVAVKFFDSSFVQKDEDLKKRFMREARLLAKIQHPNIPYVITHGQINGNTNKIPYIVMQYIEGDTLEEIIELRSPITQQEGIEYVQQVLNALSLVHSKNILHRDIKPSNIMVLNSGHCYLIDFSIGVSLEAENGLTRATCKGQHLGSIDYMSPEQSKDMTSMDERSDIYSLGIVLLEMLTGSIDKSDIGNKLSGYPVVLREAIKKACEHGIEKRHDSATEFSRALNSFTSTTRSHGQPSKACCSNLKCPSSEWSPQGYFKGPNIIEECADFYCTSCGKEMIYKCRECGGAFDDKPFCGNCGNRVFLVPECEACGSFLKSADMYTDTKSNGCSKCRANQKNQVDHSFNLDDDIPF